MGLLGMVTAFTSDSPGEESDCVMRFSLHTMVPLDAYGICGFPAVTVGLSSSKAGAFQQGPHSLQRALGAS